MANPFSGLENIGQSYLAGVQLAQQRQLREEALAQRQEEARIRERYYQDLIDQRREAAALNAKIRDEGLAIKFGRFLKRTPEGDIDIVGSATAQEEAGNRNQFLETVGFAETQGISIPGVELTPEERKSEFYNRGRAQGIVKKTADQLQMERIMASQGLFRAGRAPVSTAPVEPMITGERPETIFDILSAAPRRAPSAPSAPSRASLFGAPTSMVPVRINDQEYLTRAPRTEKAPSLGYETIELPGGGKARINLTPERAAQIQAQAAKLAAGESEPDLFADLDAAQQQLKKLRVGGEKEFNLKRMDDGTVKVVRDDVFSVGRTADQIQEDLKLERKNREQVLRESQTMPGPEDGIKQGTNRVQPRPFGNTLFEMNAPVPVQQKSQSPNRVMDVRQIPGLRPLPGR